MPEIFKYFWFICAAVMTVNLVIWRRRLATVVERGIATQSEVDTFFRGVAAWVIGGALALGVISLIAGWTSPFCAGVLASVRAFVTLLIVANAVGVSFTARNVPMSAVPGCTLPTAAR